MCVCRVTEPFWLKPFLATDLSLSSMAEEEEVAIDVRGDGGMMKTIKNAGSGEPLQEGTLVSVHCAGRFESGEQFDSSRDHETPLEFMLGARQVSLGWDLGMATMKIGERAIFKLKPDYSYGQSGSPAQTA